MTPMLIVGTLLGLVVGSYFVPTPDEIQASFKQAQKFYAAEDYEQAIATYERINAVESPLLYTAEIEVAVGEVAAPVKEIALYQTGNSYFKRAQESQRRAAWERNSERQHQLAEQTATDFAEAAAYFLETEAQTTSPQMRELARNRLVNCLYESGDYQRTIEEGRALLQKYPDSQYLDNALYNIGWAHFELGQYGESIATFEELVQHAPKGYRADRALFQIGEAYFLQQHYDQATSWYQEVVTRQDIDRLSERDLLKMRREKIAGLVDETALELAAKAQIKVGDCRAQSGDFTAAAAAYSKVITAFAQEQKLVAEAYIRLADMYTQGGDAQAAVRTYREAIDGSRNRIFQASMQSLLAEHYYGIGNYQHAIAEYQLYLDAYGDVAKAAGLAPPWALYKIGRAYYEQAEVQRQAAADDEARLTYAQAIAAYERIAADYPSSELVLAAAPFNIALCNQMLGTLGSAEHTARALELYQEIVAADQDPDYVRSALFQLGRIHYQQENFEQAIAAYESILQKYPEAPQRHGAYFELALCYRDLGQPGKAVELFRQLDRTANLFPKAMLEASNLLTAAGDFSGALEALEAGLEASTDKNEQARLHYMKGRTLIETEAFVAAVEALGPTIELADDEEVRLGALYGRGVSLLKLKRYEEATADLKRLLHSDNEELARAAQRMLGLAHLELGRQEEAIEDYQALVAAATDSVERAEHLVVLAELHYNLEEFDQVEALCQRILSLDLPAVRGEQPYSLQEKAYFLMGDAHGSRGDAQALINTYQKALSHYPDSHYSADMRFALGQTLFEREDLAGTVRVLETYLQKTPSHRNRPYALYYLGYAHFNLTQFEQAAAAFADLASAYPQSELAPDALFRAGEAHYNLGQFETARVHYQQLLEMHPRADLADDALYNLAWSHLNMERVPQAIAAFQSVVSDYPESALAANAQFTIGDFYYNEKEYDKALQAYQEVIRRFPSSLVAQKVPELIDDLREVVAYLRYAEVEEIFAQALEEQDPAQFRRAAAGFAEIARDYPGTESEIGALSNMGVCYESLGQWKDAVQVYDQVLERLADEQAEAHRFARMHKEWIEANRL